METKESKGNLEVEIKGTSPSFVNALRRIIISELPTQAIEEVEIKENNSALQDEILAHRLGLIPIKGEGKLKLKVEGPLTVKSLNLEGDSKIEIINKEIPIAELIENQRIDLTAKIKTGTGKEHAKWKGAVVSYAYKNPDKINLEIESCSSLTEKEILRKSLEILKEKVSGFRKELSGYKL